MLLPSMSAPVCLVTGGNAGIGFAAALQLARAGATVVISARNRERGEEAVSRIARESANHRVSLIRMDLASQRSILEACRDFRAAGHGHVDVLIHNAADFDISRKRPEYSPDGLETIWATNHVGAVLLTRELEPELLRSAQGRIVTVSSQGLMLQPWLKVRLDDPEFRRGGFSVPRAYYQSKLAQVMYTFWLADRFRRTAVTANCVRVTNVRVDLARYPNLSALTRRVYAVKSRFSITPDQMARVYTWLALAPELVGVTGRYFDHRRREVRAGRYAESPENVRAVMEVTERFVPDGVGVLAEPDAEGV